MAMPLRPRIKKNKKGEQKKMKDEKMKRSVHFT
nr:MAG TPA: hypothetical protein [Caudoviricetes sp.]